MSPRNFNPHPYQSGYDPRRISNENIGPVLFPTTSEQQNEQIYDNGISNVIDDQPYAFVARKKKYQFIGHSRNEVR